MEGEINIIRLSSNDWEKLKELRLRALKEEPLAFGSTYEEALERPETLWRASLNNPWYFFASLNGKLVGMVFAIKQKEKKIRHTVHIHGFYIVPEARGNRVGRMLMERLLAEVENDPEVIKIRLYMTETQKEAMSLYKSLGFKNVGVLEKEMHVDGQFYNAYTMEKFVEREI